MKIILIFLYDTEKEKKILRSHLEHESQLTYLEAKSTFHYKQRSLTRSLGSGYVFYVGWVREQNEIKSSLLLYTTIPIGENTERKSKVNLTSLALVPLWVIRGYKT